MRKLLSLFTFILACTKIFAQQYPVQVTPQLIPPYSLQVSEYYSPTLANTKLNILLLNRDFNKPVIYVRLRMSVESQSVRLRTKEDNPAVYTTIALNAGEPYYVAPAQLAQYFSVNNLDISGMSPSEYNSVGKLPEGFYTFCFEAVEVNTNQTVSNKGCSFAWMNLNEPPMLNLPVKGESVIPADNPANQTVLFTWTPRHTASPGAAFTTEYVFTIAEITDNSVAPEAAFLSTNPLDTIITTSTTLVYDGSRQALVPGKKYAWRVQAKTKDGINEIANFKNNGFSEIFWFNYKNNCPLVTNVDDSVKGLRATISWLNNPQHLDYKVIYREKNNTKAEWFSKIITGSQVGLTDLKNNTVYEYRVGAACDQGVYTFAATQEFTTGDSAQTSLVENCGVDPNLSDPTNTTAIASMIPGDSIKAGDFKVIVTKIAPVGDRFTGEGYVVVSYLAGMKLAVTFTGIKINTDKKLVDGKIQTTYDPTEGGIESVDEYIDYYTAGYGVGSVVTGSVTADTTFNFTISNVSLPNPWGPPSNFNQTTGVITGTIPITITPESGAAVTYNTEKLPVTIADKDGNVYQANANGTVTKVGSAGGADLISKTNPKQIDDDKATVTFIEHPNAKYAFDAWKEIYKKSSAFNKEYERIRTATNGDYYVSAKAIAPGETDVIKARIKLTDNTLNPANVKFISGKGIIYNSTMSTAGADTTYEITIVGGPERDAQEIYAVYPKTGEKNLNLGKILVASYPRKDYQVKIVPVNGNQLSNLSAIQAQVNSLYNKINVHVNIESLTSFSNTAWDADGDGLDVKGSSAFSLYTAEMSALIKEYKKSVVVDPSVFYVFVLDKAADSTVLGDMPRGKQFGFLFTEGNQNIDVVLSHEIGHGIFKLKHVFEYAEDFETGLVGNLLNYPAGDNLAKTQWDLINDPASIVLSFFESDKDGLYASVDGAVLPAKFKNPGSESYSFYGPTGKIYTLPSDIRSVQFSTGDLYFVEGTSDYLVHPEQIAMVGSLVSFVDKDGKKWYHTTSNTWPTITNLDFRDSAGNVYVENITYQNITKYPVIGRPCFYEGKPRLQIVNVTNPSSINISNGFTWAEVPALSKYFLDNLSRCEYMTLNMPDVGNAVNNIYLNKNAASFDKEYATHIFALADLINAMPNIQLCVYATDEGFTEYQNALSTITDQEEKNKLLREYYSKYFQLYFNFYKQKNKDPEFYFNQPCFVFSIEALCKATRVNQLGEFPCLIENVSWSTRKQLLELFSDYNSVFTNTQKDLTSSAIAVLVQNTPKSQEMFLLDFLAFNNHYQLFRLYDNLDDYNAEIFINKLVSVVNESYKSGRESAKLQIKDPLTLTSTERVDSYNIPIWKNNALTDCSSWLNTLLNGPISSTPVGNICEGFSCQRYQSDNSLVHIYKKLDGTLYVSKSSQSDPLFGFVNLHFKEDFNYANIKTGTILTVPGIYGYHFARKNRSYVNGQATRIAANTAAILGAVFTGGGSLSLLGVTSVSLAGFDIYVAVNEDKLMGTPAGQEFLSYYTKFAGAIAIIEVSAPILQATGNWIIRITPQKFRAVSAEIYKDVMTKAVDLMASAKRGVTAGIMTSESFLKFRDLITAQLLRVKVMSECRVLNKNYFNSNFENLYLNTEKLNSPIQIAEYRILDNAEILDFYKGNARLVDDEKLVDNIVSNDNFEKIGSIENTTYLKKDGTTSVNSLDIYQSKISPDEIFVLESKAVGLNNTANLSRYPNIRSFLGDGRVKAYLNSEQLLDFENLLKSANDGVLKAMDEFKNSDEFAEMIRGYKDNPTAFGTAIKNLDEFNGIRGWLTFWRLTPRIENSLNTIAQLKNGNKLIDVGSATEIELASIHAYTTNGDFVNVPFRYKPEWFGEYNIRAVKHINEGLDELRKLNSRLFKGTVFSGKTFLKSDFESKFLGKVNTIHSYNGYMSTSKLESVAEGFVELTKQWASGSEEKVAVIQRVVSKNGVYIDDLSDWGKNLGVINHPNLQDIRIQIQEEVLLNSQKLKQISDPIPAIENGVQKTIGGMKVYYIDFIEEL